MNDFDAASLQVHLDQVEESGVIHGEALGALRELVAYHARRIDGSTSMIGRLPGWLGRWIMISGYRFDIVRTNMERYVTGDGRMGYQLLFVLEPGSPWPEPDLDPPDPDVR